MPRSGWTWYKQRVSYKRKSGPFISATLLPVKRMCLSATVNLTSPVYFSALSCPPYTLSPWNVRRDSWVRIHLICRLPKWCNKPVCFDCHGVHDIVRTDDPQKGLQVCVAAACKGKHTTTLMAQR